MQERVIKERNRVYKTIKGIGIECRAVEIKWTRGTRIYNKDIKRKPVEIIFTEEYNSQVVIKQVNWRVIRNVESS